MRDRLYRVEAIILKRTDFGEADRLLTLLTPNLGKLRAVAKGGGQLYVWTVDDARLIARLTAMGVDGIITNDPRLFVAAQPGR